MNKDMFILLVGIVVVMGGCTLAPKHVRPQAPTPAAWPTGPAYKAMAVNTNGPAAADILWREFFTNDRLQKVIELALANNRDLRVAALIIEKTKAAYRIQRADLLPTVNAVGFGTRQQIFANVENFEKSVQVKYYSVNVGFSSYELDFFGRLRSLKARALPRLKRLFPGQTGCQAVFFRGPKKSRKPV